MRILVAEDDVVLRRHVSICLTAWGHEAIECCDGAEAWTVLTEPDPPRIAILDWNMPKKDGIVLCHDIRHRSDLSSLYVILITANRDRRDMIAGLESGADDYITKPVDWDELRVRLRNASRVVALQEQLALRVSELQSALTNVKTLRGMVPLCAHCRRIRDDDDYWKRLEEYVSEHSHARFSESICPECRRKEVEAHR